MSIIIIVLIVLALLVGVGGLLLFMSHYRSSAEAEQQIKPDSIALMRFVYAIFLLLLAIALKVCF